MPCAHCGKQQRYVGRDMSESERIKHRPSTVGHDATNDYSLSTLLDMKAAEAEEHKTRLRNTLSKMTEDAKAFYVISLVRIINGEDFSLQGHTSEYCINLLHKLFYFEEMDFIDKRLPGLRDRIEQRYIDLDRSRIKIDIS